MAVLALLFASCKKENKLEQQIIGKWMMTERDGHTALTDEKEVITFVSPTKAYVSKSLYGREDSIQNPNPPAPLDSIPFNPGWNNYDEYDVTIEGNTVTLTNVVTLTSYGPTGTAMSTEYQIQSISESEFACRVIFPTPPDGTVAPSDFNKEQDQSYERVTKDYKQEILGLWECTELTGIETYNDANARLEFFADGIYNYWRKDEAGQWLQVVDREFQNYFVDGTLLATRWKVIGESELREWWEISNIADNQMEWTALRQMADGSTVQQGMKWKRVE